MFIVTLSQVEEGEHRDDDEAGGQTLHIQNTGVVLTSDSDETLVENVSIVTNLKT